MEVDVKILSESNLWRVDILMILVTLGTQDKKFYRLLDAIQNQINNHNITDKVVVQAGCSSDFKSDDMEIFDLIPMNEFDSLVKKCDLLITHGGVGSIITGLKNNKKVIALARLKQFGEHTNDHQIQIVNNFAEEGYILKIEKKEDLETVLNAIDNFKPKKYKSNQKNFIKIVENEIDSYL